MNCDARTSGSHTIYMGICDTIRERMVRHRCRMHSHMNRIVEMKWWKYHHRKETKFGPRAREHESPVLRVKKSDSENLHKTRHKYLFYATHRGERAQIFAPQRDRARESVHQHQRRILLVVERTIVAIIMGIAIDIVIVIPTAISITTATVIRLVISTAIVSDRTAGAGTNSAALADIDVRKMDIACRCQVGRRRGGARRVGGGISADCQRR